MLPTDSPSERLLGRLENAWRELGDSYEGLSDAELTSPGAAGNWSVKDVIAHVTTWEEEALKHLPTVIGGGRPPRYASEGGIDAFNARTAERKAGLPLEAVLEQRDDTHGRLLEFIRAAPDEVVVSPRFVKRLRLDCYGHYKLHAEAIKAWRARSG